MKKECGAHESHSPRYRFRHLLRFFPLSECLEKASGYTPQQIVQPITNNHGENNSLQILYDPESNDFLI